MIQGSRNEKEKEIEKSKFNTYMCLWTILQNLDLGQFGLCQGLDNVTKHIRTPFESKKLKSNQNRIQIELT